MSSSVGSSNRELQLCYNKEDFNLLNTKLPYRFVKRDLSTLNLCDESSSVKEESKASASSKTQDNEISSKDGTFETVSSSQTYDTTNTTIKSLNKETLSESEEEKEYDLLSLGNNLKDTSRKYLGYCYACINTTKSNETDFSTKSEFSSLWPVHFDQDHITVQLKLNEINITVLALTGLIITIGLILYLGAKSCGPSCYR